MRAHVVVLLAWATACAKDDIPRSASGRACESAQNCPAYGCACSDGTRIVARHCINLRCTTNDEACTDACHEYGGWTRGDGGLSTCAVDSDCAPQSCVCADGQALNGGLCPQGQCAPRGLACSSLCGEHGGWIGCTQGGLSCTDDPTSCCSMSCQNGTCADTGRPPFP